MSNHEVRASVTTVGRFDAETKKVTCDPFVSGYVLAHAEQLTALREGIWHTWNMATGLRAFMKSASVDPVHVCLVPGASCWGRE